MGTAALHLDHLKPTPIGGPIDVRGRVREAKRCKFVVETTVPAGGADCARAELVAVQIPEDVGAAPTVCAHRDAPEPAASIHMAWGAVQPALVTK